jgi:hypothetical protein
MPNEIIETLTLCIGGNNDGRRVTCEATRREEYIRLPCGHLEEIYRLDRIYGRPDTHYVYVSQPMTLDDAVEMLIQKYPKGETTT